MVETRRRSARGQSPGSARSKSPAPKAPSRKPKADTEAASPGLVSALPLLALVVAYATMVFLANSTSNGAGTTVDWMGFSGKDVDAFASSLMMILVSELGDKTFFIAAVLAMKHSRAVVLVGSLGALALMTALSAIMGKILTDLLPHEYTHYLAVLLFVVFGVKLLKDAQVSALGACACLHASFSAFAWRACKRHMMSLVHSHAFNSDAPGCRTRTRRACLPRAHRRSSRRWRQS